jgi:hypothetical protein
MENDSTATILVERLELSKTPPAVFFFGKITGVVAPGMSIAIPMNASFSMTCEVSEVRQEGQDSVLVVTADDLGEAEFLASFNPVNEALLVSSS